MARIRALPWARVLAIARIILERVGDDIPKKDRERLTVLLRKSKGDPRRLSVNERHEVFTIIRKVDVVRLGRDVASVAALSRAPRLLKR